MHRTDAYVNIHGFNGLRRVSAVPVVNIIRAALGYVAVIVENTGLLQAN